MMAAVLWWFGGDVATWLVTPKIERVVWLSGLVVGGIAVYFASLWVMGVRAGQFRLQHTAPSV